MSTLSDLLSEHATLAPAAAEHLQRLVLEWQLIADLSFADLLLWISRDEDLVCVAQVRPTTAATAHPDDEVGQVLTAGAQYPLSAAARDGRMVREGEPDWSGDLPIRREALPVRFGGKIVALLARDTNLLTARSPSRLELMYLRSGDDLCQMVAAGSFPHVEPVGETLTGPRAGDGLLRLDAEGVVAYASPNAMSAYRRLGVTGDLIDNRLGPLTRALATDPFNGNAVAARILAALAGQAPPRIEVEAQGATVLFRALPLRPPGAPPGALVLVRDITDVRRRDRQLLTKDATIREIHHRVKNNLQTVAALLRLQARRVSAPAARVALQESVRRVASIALVHETLATSLDETVDFDGIMDRLVPMVLEVARAEAATVTRITVHREGSFGILPAETATPLVMVLTELLHNAAEHAFADTPRGTVRLEVGHRAHELLISLADDGSGLPPGFSLEASDRLGLQIVRTLVESELGGTIRLGPGTPAGVEAVLRIPLLRR